VRYLLRGGSGALIALSGGRVTPVTLADLQDPQTGRVRVRTVDVTTEGYEAARSYMIRLEPGDLTEPRLSQLAAQTNLAPADFSAAFAAVGRG
jgi:ATP-dependent phosphofructokinase / diphosphate-dependent phosphofructokinase